MQTLGTLLQWMALHFLAGMAILLVEQSVAIASEMTDRAYVLSVGKVIHEVPAGGWQAMLSDPSLVRAYLHG